MKPPFVMAALEAAIHGAQFEAKDWMAGSSPAMTGVD